MSLERPEVVELRQYTLHGGRRDDLIRLFRQHFIEPQNAVGARVIGHYRDLDDADRFVWLRGFADMQSRPDALEAFYGGEVWKAHREAANATMLDSDNVLLLKPLTSADAATLLRIGADRSNVVRIAIHYLAREQLSAFSDFFMKQFMPRAAACGARRLAVLLSEAAANNFPKLPVREQDCVFVWVAELADARQLSLFARNIAALSGWRDGVNGELLPALMRKSEIVRVTY